MDTIPKLRTALSMAIRPSQCSGLVHRGSLCLPKSRFAQADDDAPNAMTKRDRKVAQYDDLRGDAFSLACLRSSPGSYGKALSC